jgi:hypothetical protein
MGGHGGLNILPQKRWNVYNFDNRQKVEKDVKKAQEEEDAKAKREREAKSALRYEQLRNERKKKKKRDQEREDEEEKVPVSKLSTAFPTPASPNFLNS